MENKTISLYCLVSTTAIQVVGVVQIEGHSIFNKDFERF